MEEQSKQAEEKMKLESKELLSNKYLLGYIGFTTL